MQEVNSLCSFDIVAVPGDKVIVDGSGFTSSPQTTTALHLCRLLHGVTEASRLHEKPQRPRRRLGTSPFSIDFRHFGLLPF